MMESTFQMIRAVLMIAFVATGVALPVEMYFPQEHPAMSPTIDRHVPSCPPTRVPTVQSDPLERVGPLQLLQNERDVWHKMDLWDPLGLNPFNWFDGKPDPKQGANQKKTTLEEHPVPEQGATLRENQLKRKEQALARRESALKEALSTQQMALKLAQKVNTQHEAALKKGDAARAAEGVALNAAQDALAVERSLLKMRLQSDSLQSEAWANKIVAEESVVQAAPSGGDEAVQEEGANESSNSIDTQGIDDAD